MSRVSTFLKSFIDNLKRETKDNKEIIPQIEQSRLAEPLKKAAAQGGLVLERVRETANIASESFDKGVDSLGRTIDSAAKLAQDAPIIKGTSEVVSKITETSSNAAEATLERISDMPGIKHVADAIDSTIASKPKIVDANPNAGTAIAIYNETPTERMIKKVKDSWSSFVDRAEESQNPIVSRAVDFAYTLAYKWERLILSDIGRNLQVITQIDPTFSIVDAHTKIEPFIPMFFEAMSTYNTELLKDMCTESFYRRMKSILEERLLHGKTTRVNLTAVHSIEIYNCHVEPPSVLYMVQVQKQEFIFNEKGENEGDKNLADYHLIWKIVWEESESAKWLLAGVEQAGVTPIVV